MMNSIKLGAIAAVLMAGTALAGTTMTYTLELGGDNHASQWLNPLIAGLTPPCQNASIFPQFTGAGSVPDGTVVTAGTVITWTVKVAVGGSVSLPVPGSDPVTYYDYVPKGAANMVASLELRDSASQLVAVSGEDAGAPKWLSTANPAGGIAVRQGNCSASPADQSLASDQKALAAFPVAWNADGSADPFTGTKYARVIDALTEGGPLGGETTAYWQYPSGYNYPTGSTASAGTLVGIGAGYSKFTNSIYAGTGICSVGIGVTTASSADCGVALGVGPVFEGQLDTTGMNDGTYTLTVIPGTGNNVLKDPFDQGAMNCELLDNKSFAMKADSTTGSSITFVITGGVVAPVVKASAPSPADNATCVAANPSLDWTVGDGTSETLTVDGSLVTFAKPYALSGLAAGSVHTWRVDEVSAGGTLTGDTWTFTVSPTVPAAASTPNHNGDSVTVGAVTLTWVGDNANAASYDVTVNGVTTNVVAPTNSLATTAVLGANTWSVVTNYACGTVAGPSWGFTGTPPAATIAGRWLYYPTSSWGAAIATDKAALRVTGTKANLLNICTFSKGIKGLYVDINNPAGTITAADFTYRKGLTVAAMAPWVPSPAPTVTVTPGAGTGGSTRVSLVFADLQAGNPIWLEVTVLANANTGLAAPDVFYWGSLIGKTVGGTGTALAVGSADYGATYAARLPTGQSKPITDPYDFDRNKFVLSADYSLAYAKRNNVLNLITVP